MATIRVEQASIGELKSAIMFSAERASEAAELVAKALNGISGMSFLAKPRVDSELSSLKARLDRQARLGQECCRAVREAVDLLAQTDDLAKSSSETVWGKAMTQLVIARAGTAASLLTLGVTEGLRRHCEINGICTGGGSGGGVTKTPSANGGSQDQDDGAAGAKGNGNLPDWAKEYSDLYSQRFRTADGGTGEIATYNTANYDISCTFYTLRKLRERGLGFPFQSSGVSYNGANWFGNCTDDVPKAAGEHAIETLLSGRGTLENVVVSFPGSANTWNCGHVMLIDKIYQDPSTGQTMVSYTDNCNFETNTPIYGADGSSPIYTQTLDAFKTRYINFHGGMNGAILIGGGK